MERWGAVRRALICIGWVAALCGEPARAQVDLSGWPQVRVEVLAVDADGTAVAGLTAADLTLRGGKGKARPVEALTQAEASQSVCVLLDSSDADRLSLMKAKAKKLMLHLAPEDEVCVAAFANDLLLAQPYTNDRREAVGALETIPPAGGTQTRDALIKLAAYMREHSKNRSRAIVLFSDGTDQHSSGTEAQLVRALEAEGSPVIHMICLPQAFGNARRKQIDPMEAAAFRLTALGGGMTYFPHNMGDMNALVERLPEAMRTRYVLTYTADDPARNGHEERLQVAVDKTRGGGKLHVQAPEAYRAPEQ